MQSSAPMVRRRHVPTDREDIANSYREVPSAERLRWIRLNAVARQQSRQDSNARRFGGGADSLLTIFAAATQSCVACRVNLGSAFQSYANASVATRWPMVPDAHTNPVATTAAAAKNIAISSRVSVQSLRMVRLNGWTIPQHAVQ
jgi:hypothetical protein